MKGKFIAFEGPDGVGKSSIIKRLKEDLLNDRKLKLTHNIMFDREPYERGFRELLDDPQSIFNRRHNTDDERMYVEFIKDRRSHQAKMIKHFYSDLDKINDIVMDRYRLSTFCYNTDGSDDEVKRFLELHNGMFVPDVTICLLAPISIIIDRINKRNTTGIIFEKEDMLKRVTTTYERLCHPSCRLYELDNIIKIDASVDFESVYKKVYDIVIYEFNNAKR